MQDLFKLREKKIAAQDTPFKEGTWRHKTKLTFHYVQCFFYPEVKWVVKPIIGQSLLSGRHEYGEPEELTPEFWEQLESWI